MSSTPVTTETVWETLRTILDPEFAISIVDLGLIYEVECREGNVRVIMTLTTPTCPSGAWIRGGVETAVRALPGVNEVQVDLVFEPAWHSNLLTDEGRRQLGWGSAVR